MFGDKIEKETWEISGNNPIDLSMKSETKETEIQSWNTFYEVDKRPKVFNQHSNDLVWQQCERFRDVEEEISIKGMPITVIVSNRSTQDCTDVNCECLSITLDAMLLFCKYCETYQHGPCYGFHTSAHVQGLDHVCGSCSVKYSMECTSEHIGDFCKNIVDRTEIEISTFIFKLIVQRALVSVVDEEYKKYSDMDVPCERFYKTRFKLNELECSKLVEYLETGGMVQIRPEFKVNIETILVKFDDIFGYMETQKKSRNQTTMTVMNMGSTRDVCTGSSIRSSRDVSTGSNIRSTRDVSTGINVVKVDKSVSASVVMSDVSVTADIDKIKQSNDSLGDGIGQKEIEKTVVDPSKKEGKIIKSLILKKVGVSSPKASISSPTKPVFCGNLNPTADNSVVVIEPEKEKSMGYKPLLRDSVSPEGEKNDEEDNLEQIQQYIADTEVVKDGVADDDQRVVQLDGVKTVIERNNNKEVVTDVLAEDPGSTSAVKYDSSRQQNYVDVYCWDEFRYRASKRPNESDIPEKIYSIYFDEEDKRRLLNPVFGQIGPKWKKCERSTRSSNPNGHHFEFTVCLDGVVVQAYAFGNKKWCEGMLETLEEHSYFIFLNYRISEVMGTFFTIHRDCKIDIGPRTLVKPLTVYRKYLREKVTVAPKEVAEPEPVTPARGGVVKDPFAKPFKPPGSGGKKGRKKEPNAKAKSDMMGQAENKIHNYLIPGGKR